MALRNYKYEQETEVIHELQTSQYHDYEDKSENGQKLKELMFFLNIVIFSITCVLATFIFLSLKMNSVSALIFSLPVGLLALQSFRLGLKWYKTRKK